MLHLPIKGAESMVLVCSTALEVESGLYQFQLKKSRVPEAKQFLKQRIDLTKPKQINKRLTNFKGDFAIVKICRNFAKVLRKVVKFERGKWKEISWSIWGPSETATSSTSPGPTWTTSRLADDNSVGQFEPQLSELSESFFLSFLLLPLDILILGARCRRQPTSRFTWAWATTRPAGRAWTSPTRANPCSDITISSELTPITALFATVRH